jgi:hypothetical protein
LISVRLYLNKILFVVTENDKKFKYENNRVCIPTLSLIKKTWPLAPVPRTESKWNLMVISFGMQESRFSTFSSKW